MTIADIMREIEQVVEDLDQEIRQCCTHLYNHPELSGEEYQSAKHLGGIAERHGFQVEHGIAGLPTAFVGRLSILASAGRPRIAYLAEYDALPGVGHGCGHNMIGTAGTYAAIALASVAEKLHADVVLYGTPAEETDGGKITMLDAGVFEGVTAAMMVHPGVYTEIAYTSLASISVMAEFFGRSAHAAASPWKGINALDAMIQLFVGIDMAKKQLPPTARVPGVILKGGERGNMVPDYTQAQFSLRGKDKEEAELVFRKWIECGEAAAKATGATFKYTQDSNPYHDMRPDPELAAYYREAWQTVGGDEPATESKPHGSLDIANLSHVFPCLHPAFKITHDEGIGAHTAEFAEATQTEFAHEQLKRAIKALAITGTRVGMKDYNG